MNETVSIDLWIESLDDTFPFIEREGKVVLRVKMTSEQIRYNRLNLNVHDMRIIMEPQIRMVKGG